MSDSVKSTSEVLDHHQKCFGARDLDGLVADYSADAVFFGPEGVARGPDAIRPIFAKLFAEFSLPGVSFARKQQLLEGDYARTVWSAETSESSYEFASDTFVVQNGMIRFQAFAAKIKSKH